jgi:hypothetical protein
MSVRAVTLIDREAELAALRAARAAARGGAPQLVVVSGRRGLGEPCEVDVLGLLGSRTALLGEARWQSRPLNGRDLAQLQHKALRAPRPVDSPTFALWGRGGVAAEIRSERVLGFTPADMLGG